MSTESIEAGFAVSRRALAEVLAERFGGDVPGLWAIAKPPLALGLAELVALAREGGALREPEGLEVDVLPGGGAGSETAHVSVYSPGEPGIAVSAPVAVKGLTKTTSVIYDTGTEVLAEALEGVCAAAARLVDGLEAALARPRAIGREELVELMGRLDPLDLAAELCSRFEISDDEVLAAEEAAAIA
jgi:hypothetical protein